MTTNSYQTMTEVLGNFIIFKFMLQFSGQKGQILLIKFSHFFQTRWQFISGFGNS